MKAAPVAKLEESCAQSLREATARVTDRLAGQPAWKMSRTSQLELARLAAEYLRACGANRVWLFGSLARGRQPGVHSDFDLAFEGLPAERLVGCLGSLLQWLPLPVDLVDLESASPQLRDRIVKEGVTV